MGSSEAPEQRAVARSPRARVLLLAVVLSGAVLFCSLVVGADAARQSTCATLEGKHLVVSGGHASVVTQLINRESERSGIERVAYICASPSGHAWRVGSVGSPGPEVPRIEVVTGAGEWVVLRFEYVIGEGFGGSESAANALTGKHFQFWRASGGMGSFEGDSLEAVKLDRQGRLALITGVEGKPNNEGEVGPTVTRKVIGVTSSGKRQVLDSAPTANIPTSSLQLIGGVVHWTDDGSALSSSSELIGGSG